MLKATRRIGASKLATVFECQPPTGSPVAVKLFDRAILSPFQHETLFSAATAWQSLSNPRLVPYLDVVPQENQIIMELLDRNAAVRLSEGHSDPRLVLFVLREVLEGLAYIHDRGLLHLNLKPTNVFFGPQGHALLSDGMLLRADIPGTLPPPTNQKYLTPEHTSDAFGAMSPATDLYAAGFLALELLAGERFGRAFQGVGDEAGDDDLAWFQWHGSMQVAPEATAFAKSCPAELTNVIARLVAKMPMDRYRSAQQALDDLPQDIIAAQAAVAPVAAVKREALASHVMERPANGIVLVVASGARAGEMVGTDEPQFDIGFSEDCLVHFAPEHHPGVSSRLRVQRGPEGWIVRREAGNTAYINQYHLETQAALRSGDILRLSLSGPDLQFTLQSGGVAIRSLVNRFLPEYSPQNGQKGPGAGSAAPSAPVAPSRPGIAVEGPTRDPAGQTAVAKRVTAVPVAPGKPVAAGVSASSRSATGAVPLGPAPPKPRTGTVTPPSAPKPVSSPVQPTPPKKLEASVKRSSNSDQSTSGSLLKPSTWTKNQKNMVIAVVGCIVIGLLVFLVPSGESKPRTVPEETSGGPASSPTIDNEQPATDDVQEQDTSVSGEA